MSKKSRKKTDIEEIYSICDQVFSDNHKRVEKLGKRIMQDIERNLTSAGISLHDKVGKHCYADSKEKLIAISRVRDLVDGELNICELFSMTSPGDAIEE